MKLRECSRSAIVAWSPIRGYPSLFASGTIAGAIDASFSSTGKVEIFKAYEGDRHGFEPLGGCESSEKLNSIAWGRTGVDNGSHSMGIIGGGLSDGTITLWDAKALSTSSADAELIKVETHSGAVNGIDFNTFQPNLVASGSINSEVYISDISRLDAPSKFSPGQHRAEAAAADITRVGWNSKVAHIVATASSNGYTSVWDLKQKKAVVSIADANSKGRISAMAWNPDIATQIAVACDDDRNPYLQIWDLRSSSYPLRDLRVHERGILSIAWCPLASNFLLSSGKDGKTLCWDPAAGHVISEVRSSMESTETTTVQSEGSEEFFGGGGDGADFFSGGGSMGGSSTGEALGGQTGNVDMKWSHHSPGLVTMTTVDGRLQVHSLSDPRSAGSGQGRPTRHARWLQRQAGVAFGFGGKIISFGNATAAPAAPGQKRKPDTVVNVLRVADVDKDLLVRTESLKTAMDEEDIRNYCSHAAAECQLQQDDKSAMIWNMMAAMGEADVRRSILVQLGFNVDDMPKSGGQEPVPTLTAAPIKKRNEDDMFVHHEEENDGADFFNEGAIGSLDLSSEPAQEVEVAQATISGAKPIDVNPQEDAEVQRWLVVGNIEKAVQTCMDLNRFADALVLASIHSPELWDKIKNEYLARQAAAKEGKSHLASIMAGIVGTSMEEFVANIKLEDWKDALAVICTYAERDTFKALCGQLGTRLEGAGDYASACLCFICALDVESAMSVWAKSSSAGAAGRGGVWVLLSVVEMVISFIKLINPDTVPGSVAMKVLEFAEIVAAQGEMNTAQWLTTVVETSDNEVAGLAVSLKERLSRALQPTTSVASQDAHAAAAAASGTGLYGSHPAPAAVSGRAAPQAQPQAETQYWQQPQQQVADQYQAEQQYAGGYAGYSQPSQYGYTAPQPEVQPVVQPQATYTQGHAQETYSAYSEQQTTSYAQQSQYPQTQPQQQQYANEYAAAAAAPSTQPSAAGSQGYAGAETAQRWVPTDFDSFDSSQAGDMAGVVREIQGLAQRLSSLPNLPPVQKKKLEDSKKRTVDLFGKLMQGQVSAGSCERLQTLAHALSTSDFKTANECIVKLTTSDWSGNQTWMTGIKTLIQLGKTSFR